jgi:hypothetical protein
LKALLVLGVLLLLLIWLLQSRLWCAVRGDGGDGWQVWAGLGVFRVRVYPPKPAVSKPRRDKRAKKKRKEKPAKAGRHKKTPGQTWTLQRLLPLLRLPLLRPALEIGGRALGRIWQSLRFNRLEFHITWGNEDPADAAVQYGIVRSALGVLLPLIEERVPMGRRARTLDLDYSLDKPKIFCRVAVSVRLGRLLAVGFSAALRLLLLFLRLRREEKPRQQTRAERAGRR